MQVQKGKLSDPKTIWTREYLLGTVQLHKAESFVCDKVNERGDHFYFQCPLHTYNYDIMDRMENMRSTSSIYSVIIGGRLENDNEWKVDSNQLFFNLLSMSTRFWPALININYYQLNCELLLSISMSTSIVPILAYQLSLINALNISAPQVIFL